MVHGPVRAKEKGGPAVEEAGQGKRRGPPLKIRPLDAKL